MLVKPSSNVFQRTGGDHWGGRAQPGWRTFMMTCLRWILGYMRLEIWHKSASGDWCLCTALCTRSGACYCWAVFVNHNQIVQFNYNLTRQTPRPVWWAFTSLSNTAIFYNYRILIKYDNNTAYGSFVFLVDLDCFVCFACNETRTRLVKNRGKYAGFGVNGTRLYGRL